jgi:predicted nuclease of predicted toxin-antitoxin system
MPNDVVRLKVDENLPDEIADLFNANGCDAVTVVDQGWRGLADNELWLRIQAEGRWLVTADKEFADLRRCLPGTHAGVILLRATQEGLDEYLFLAETLLKRVKLEENGGAVIVATDRGVRVRRAP